jgi:hypothetical protein
VLHGLGGMGKTELALTFGRRNVQRLQVGAWKLSAEGCGELLPLIGSLTYALGLPAGGPDETGELRGHRVLNELKRLARAVGRLEEGGAALLVLDNLDVADLLVESELKQLSGEDWLKIIATTRLGPEALPAENLHWIAVDCLPEEAAVSLI